MQKYLEDHCHIPTERKESVPTFSSTQAGLYEGQIKIKQYHQAEDMVYSETHFTCFVNAIRPYSNWKAAMTRLIQSLQTGPCKR